MTTNVSRTWRCTKWTCRVLRIVALPGKPPTRHTSLRYDRGKDIRYDLGTSRVWGWGSLSGLSGPTCDRSTDGSPGTPPPGLHKTWAADPLSESLLVSETLLCHPEAIGLCGVAPYCTTGLAIHTHCLIRVGAHTISVK